MADIEIFRVESNPWGQKLIIGLSWDLLWVFFGLAVLFVVAHILFTWLWLPRVRRRLNRSLDNKTSQLSNSALGDS